MEEEIKSLNFIEQIIEKDLSEGKNEKRVHTRFPPEPNGYLHIGHAKSICLNGGLAKKYNGKFNLRFDDTNPETEEEEYVKSIRNDVQWLGFQWDNEFCASDYFDQLYEYAVQLIKADKAFVCSLTSEQTSEYRGNTMIPGKNSPDRDRSIEENLDLFNRMKNGEFPDGKYTLRAKIDMASQNMHFRDPAMYRIRKKHHWRTGNKWNIYPMYDYAHGVSDAIEGITHSVCTLEFEVHRPLYEWFNNTIATKYRPQQIEMSRLNITYTVMSKRKLMQLVNEKHVSGWDDPRMPTISGLRRRGYTPEAIRDFCERVGISKRENLIDVSLLEFSIREDLNKKAPRVMGVLNPLKVVITNYPDDQIEELEAINNPEKPEDGSRMVPFSKEIYIEQEDFQEVPAKKWFRLAPGTEVRLRYAYFITCQEIIKDASGKITELHCTYDPASRGGNSPDGRKVKGTIHWVSATKGIPAEVRLYDRLFTAETPDKGDVDFKELINPNSLQVIKSILEPSLAEAKAGETFQFERMGYFCVDKESSAQNLVFNRTVTLKDGWAKQAEKN
ncbi:MAG: glutamine--tRNA ligase/YqeY domain fusion protein [Bacteroidetes bacterium]|nr:glutamine--tRNA ligase/YqeY domain fusion protein [Bacteroidota bacterium]